MDQVSFLRELLIEDVAGTAHWRVEKAAEYPHDADRNLEAAKDLSALAESLENIPADDLLWAEYAGVNDAAAEGSEAIRLAELLSDIIRQIGFYHAAPSGREFLQELIREARKVAAETV